MHFTSGCRCWCHQYCPMYTGAAHIYCVIHSLLYKEQSNVWSGCTCRQNMIMEFCLTCEFCAVNLQSSCNLLYLPLASEAHMVAAIQSGSDLMMREWLWLDQRSLHFQLWKPLLQSNWIKYEQGYHPQCYDNAREVVGPGNFRSVINFKTSTNWFSWTPSFCQC